MPSDFEKTFGEIRNRGVDHTARRFSRSWAIFCAGVSTFSGACTPPSAPCQGGVRIPGLLTCVDPRPHVRIPGLITCEDPRPHACMCAAYFCPGIFLSHATPLGRSRYQMSEFPTTSEFPIELPSHRERGFRSPGMLKSCTSSRTVLQFCSFTILPLYCCKVLQLYSCTVVQLYSCKVVQLYSCTVMQSHSWLHS